MRLGKREARQDERTLRLSLVMAEPPRVPEKWDFDKYRKAFPLGPWGNNLWGDCVMAARANHALRMERIEHRTTLQLTTDDVVNEYKAEVARQFGTPAPLSPGDPNDNGLYMLEALKDWRGDAWDVKFRTTSKAKQKQNIAAFGALDPANGAELRAAIYLLSGIQLGLNLPETAAWQWNNGKPWDDMGVDDPEAQPGSWGGHAVFSKRYDKDGIYVLTWGQEVFVTNRFLQRYCDEAWACVNDLSSTGRYIDVPKLKQYLVDIGAHIES